MPKSYVQFFLNKRSIDVERELRAQIEKVLATNLRVTHLNGHQHLHMLPSIFAIVRQLAIEYAIPYVRRVDDRGGRVLLLSRRIQITLLSALGRRAAGTNARTIGVMEAGHLTAPRIIELLDSVDGITELVTHPGVNVSNYGHWRYAWAEETRALCDPRVREAIAQRGIALIAPSMV
jgi:predicted glycoside hydrolase/deacetylase ChbG (UPF0249 family)